MTIDRAEAFEADIAASPAALARCLEAWRPVALGGRSRFAFTGLGSSRYAALIVASALRATGTMAWAEYASSSTPTTPADDLVLVAISASGRTPEVVASAAAHRGTSLVVAVTNVLDSPLAAQADITVALEAGEETSGIACRTFRATIASLALLTGLVTSTDLDPVVDGLAARLDAADGWRSRFVDALDGAASIDVLADASLLGLAEQAALMLREGPRLPATAYDTGDWLHTGVYLALPGHRVLLFPGAPADPDVIATVERRGGQVLIVDAQSGGTDAQGIIRRAIADSIVGERIAAALWVRARAQDKTP